LAAALRKAIHTLVDPIEGSELTDRGVVAWAGGRLIHMTYRWNIDHTANGARFLGGVA